jgi:hypothetical protein
LPSYTVLPIRVTTPPMIAGSTCVFMSTLRPVKRRERLFDLRHAFRRQRRGRRDFGTDHLLVLHQPFRDTPPARQRRW